MAQESYWRMPGGKFHGSVMALMKASDFDGVASVLITRSEPVSRSLSRYFGCI